MKNLIVNKIVVSKLETPIQIIQGCLMDIGAALARGRVHLDFIFSGFLRGTVGILAGASGTGKSFYALQLALGLICRQLNSLNISYREEIAVAYFSLEETPEVVANRLFSCMQACTQEVIDLVSKNLKIASLYGNNFDIVAYKDAITSFLALPENKNIGLVIIDTFSRSHDKDENSTAEMATLLKTTFEEIAVKSNVAVLILHHLSKAGSQSGDKTQHAMRGSSTLNSNTRWKGNLTTMSELEAESFYNPDSSGQVISSTLGLYKQFVMMSEACSYSASPPPVWLRRGSDGVLSPIELSNTTNSSFTKNKKKTVSAPFAVAKPPALDWQQPDEVPF
jgi:RecA-family ATPase